MPSGELYEGREQTYIKHFILERYLQKLAYKKGFYGHILNYVDCFAGPWQNTSEALQDTSPLIAIKELRAARDRIIQSGNSKLRIRCLFIEKDKQAYARLSEHLREVDDLHIEILNGEFEDNIGRIRSFASGEHKTFSFFFIDPTGWTGYPLEVITPLLQHPHCEVLINFMTKDIIRFIDNDRPSDIESFNRLFGRSDYRDRWKQKIGLDREEEIVATYGNLVREAGAFKFVVPTVILNPLKDRTQFHLIYATRHIEGLRVFRNEAEKKAHEAQQGVRWQAARRREQEVTGQMGLFQGPVGRSYLDELEERYRLKAHELLMAIIREKARVPFDDLETEALQFPLMHTQALKDWLEKLRSQGMIYYGGLAPGERALKPDKGHFVATEHP